MKGDVRVPTFPKLKYFVSVNSGLTKLGTLACLGPVLGSGPSLGGGDWGGSGPSPFSVPQKELFAVTLPANVTGGKEPERVLQISLLVNDLVR